MKISILILGLFALTLTACTKSVESKYPKISDEQHKKFITKNIKKYTIEPYELVSYNIDDIKILERDIYGLKIPYAEVMYSYQLKINGEVKKFNDLFIRYECGKNCSSNEHWFEIPL